MITLLDSFFRDKWYNQGSLVKGLSVSIRLGKTLATTTVLRGKRVSHQSQTTLF